MTTKLDYVASHSDERSKALHDLTRTTKEHRRLVMIKVRGSSERGQQGSAASAYLEQLAVGRSLNISEGVLLMKRKQWVADELKTRKTYEGCQELRHRGRGGRVRVGHGRQRAGCGGHGADVGHPRPLPALDAQDPAARARNTLQEPPTLSPHP